ncbi:MAG: 2-amino-4-hydroxy-6-hydroxymethyldihydropteridine diphosphokinase [Bacteroidota bacterium]
MLAYISLGGNLGNTKDIFQEALQEIEKYIGTIVHKSSLYQTAAWGNTLQNDFLNQVISVETILSPKKLLDSLLTIEIKFKRERLEKWGPRTLDLDILYIEHEVIVTNELSIPHPRIEERKFILIPLHEIAPDFRDPRNQLTISELLYVCTDELTVLKIN